MDLFALATLPAAADEAGGPPSIKFYELRDNLSRAAVGDFGLVQLPDVESLNDGRIPGAFGFIADEVLADPTGAEGGPADVFALAKTLWVVLSDQEFPPQGHIRADRGAATLSRKLVVGGIAALDQVVDRATAPVQIRLTMRQLADELAAWAVAPRSSQLPADTAQALQRARNAMQATFTERDAEHVRGEAFEEACELVRRHSDELLHVLEELDPAVELGPYANDFLHKYTEPSEYLGGPVIEHHAHWGAKISKGPSYFPTVLLIDFGIGMATDGNVHLAVFAMAGHERTSGGEHFGPHESVVPMRSIQLEHAVNQLVQVVGQRLPGLLDAFAREG
jgi:hypothetical protein